jgi:phosphatidylethanolamine/phosphatidyl-N-methylethanolamine N-methyltransferase
MSPFSKLTGFHPNLNLEEFLEDTQLEVVQISSANLFGYWKVVRCRNAMDKAMVA